MKKRVQLSALVFIILMPVVFFVIGIYFAGLIKAGQNQGLAAGAIVLWWGMIFGFVAFVLSFFTIKIVKNKYIVRLNYLLLILVFLLYGLSYLRIQQKRAEVKKEYQKEEKQVKSANRPDLQPTQQTSFFQTSLEGEHISLSSAVNKNPVSIQPEKGIGMFSPELFNNNSFYFYGNPNFSKTVNDHVPQDSITFEKTQYGHFEITYAPPYFFPEHLKLDYDILYLKVISASREFLEVEVNKETGQTAYINRYKGTLKYWPDFLLGVHSVEFIDSKNQLVKIKPLDHASDVRADFVFMHPKIIKNDWMKVDLTDQNFNKVSEGWIKWKENNIWKIKYSLLS